MEHGKKVKKRNGLKKMNGLAKKKFLPNSIQNNLKMQSFDNMSIFLSFFLN